jgi:hypothetical protein
VVKATREFSTDPVKFLMDAKAKYPNAFTVDRGGHLTTFVTDPSLFDDILSDEEMFNPDFSKSMPTNHNVCQIPKVRVVWCQLLPPAPRNVVVRGWVGLGRRFVL